MEFLHMPKGSLVAYWVTVYCHIGSNGEELAWRCMLDDRVVKEVWEGWGPTEWRCDVARGLSIPAKR